MTPDTCIRDLEYTIMFFKAVKRIDKVVVKVLRLS